ncbi:MAG: 30S ribosomal protein S27ae [Candidatus Woesearchaeota archaeon]
MAAKKDIKGKKPAVIAKKPSKRLHTLFTISGDKIIRNNKTCPKCGPGMFLAKHKDRTYCGKCHYTEFQSKKSPEN